MFPDSKRDSCISILLELPIPKNLQYFEVFRPESSLFKEKFVLLMVDYLRFNGLGGMANPFARSLVDSIVCQNDIENVAFLEC